MLEISLGGVVSTVASQREGLHAETFLTVETGQSDHFERGGPPQHVPPPFKIQSPHNHNQEPITCVAMAEVKKNDCPIMLSCHHTYAFRCLKLKHGFDHAAIQLASSLVSSGFLQLCQDGRQEA